MRLSTSILFFVYFSFLFSCQKPEASITYPCKGIQLPSNESIKIREKLLYNEFETDTVTTSNAVMFSVPSQFGYTSYQWSISGSEQVYNTSSFTTVFLNDTGKFEVTLIAKRPRMTDCFLKDDGVDTLKRTFVVLPHANSPIIGEFEGTHEGESEKFVVSIGYHPEYGYHIKNINKGCTQGSIVYDNVGLRIYHGGNSFEMDYRDTESLQYQCYSPLAKGYLENNSKLVVEYSYGDIAKPYGANGRPRISKKFIGYRK